MPSLSNYICVKCEKEMRAKKNGVIVEEHREDGLPYKIWEADLWECPKCHHQCICGFGHNPIVHHFDAKYEQVQKFVEFHIK